MTQLADPVQVKSTMLALLADNDHMQPDTTPAESPANDRPVYRLNTNPPLPVAELRNDELELLVGSRALLTRGQPPEVQAQVDERIRQAWDELKRRGVHEVPVTHWHFGSARRTPPDASLHDQHWYKRPASMVTAMQSWWWRLLACFNR